MYAVADNSPKLVFEAERLDKCIESLAADTPVSMFRLKALNELLGGVHPGLMYAIGATPGGGKTTLLVQIADALAEAGHAVLFISCELPEAKLIQKSLSRIAGMELPLSEVADASSPEHPKHEVFLKALEHYRDTIAPNIIITGLLNLTELGHLVSACKNERGQVPVIFIDYLQLMACGNSGNAFVDERLAIAACVQGLRDLASFYSAPVFALSTVTRNFYASKKLDLGVFGGSSTVEYSFDSALYLTRDCDGTKFPNTELTGAPLELIALKNRYGRLGSAKLDFDAEHATFRDRG